MRKVNLKITNSNIKNGKLADPANCPIANAIKKQFRGLAYVSVLADRAFVAFKKGNKVTKYNSTLTKEATQFVKCFDRGSKVHPFKFELVLNK
jgi:hypothetical protein